MDELSQKRVEIRSCYVVFFEGPVDYRPSDPGDCQVGGPCRVDVYAIMPPSVKNDDWRVAMFSSECGVRAMNTPEMILVGDGRSQKPEVTIVDMGNPQSDQQGVVNMWKDSSFFKSVTPTPEMRYLEFTWTDYMVPPSGKYYVCLCTGSTCTSSSASVLTLFPFPLVGIRLEGNEKNKTEVEEQMIGG